jgi:hypothetical protein
MARVGRGDLQVPVRRHACVCARLCFRAYVYSFACGRMFGEAVRLVRCPSSRSGASEGAGEGSSPTVVILNFAKFSPFIVALLHSAKAKDEKLSFTQQLQKKNSSAHGPALVRRACVHACMQVSRR